MERKPRRARIQAHVDRSAEFAFPSLRPISRSPHGSPKSTPAARPEKGALLTRTSHRRSMVPAAGQEHRRASKQPGARIPHSETARGAREPCQSQDPTARAIPVFVTVTIPRPLSRTARPAASSETTSILLVIASVKLRISLPVPASHSRAVWSLAACQNFATVRRKRRAIHHLFIGSLEDMEFFSRCHVP